MYEETLNEVLLYEKSDVKNENVRDQFTNSLTSILNRHRSVVELVAHGVMEYKEDVREKGARTIEEEKIQYFLDRFYMSRIAIRVLINQHGKTFLLMKWCVICDIFTVHFGTTTSLSMTNIIFSFNVW